MFVMKKIPIIGIAVLTLICTTLASAQTHSNQIAEIQSELETLLRKLSKNIETMDNMQGELENLVKIDKDYAEQKNILMSSILALSAISAICEYENDMISLYIELKPENKAKFYDVRIQSLETSIKQIENFQQQLKLNHSILPYHPSESYLTEKEEKLIKASVDLLRNSIALLKSLKLE